MMEEAQELELGGKTILLETGKVARAANGAVFIQSGETIVLVTTVMVERIFKGAFLPLTVDVEEKMYAAGKIPGGFFRREGRPSEKSILAARLIDRSLRPSFSEGFRNEVQIIATILSVDQVNPPDILALNGASAALSFSDIPFEGPIGAVRIARAQGRWIINPTYQELKYSDIDLVLTENKKGLLMVEVGAKEVSEEDLLKAFEEGHKAIGKLIDFQERLQQKIGPVKKVVSLSQVDLKIENKVRKLAQKKLEQAQRISSSSAQKEKIAQLKEGVLRKLAPSEESELREQVVEAFSELEKELARQKILKEKLHLDGRKPNEIRPIHCEVHILPRTHGSGLFTRGREEEGERRTQVLSVLTLGTIREEQILDGLEAEESKRFLHHYNFPPFSTKEITPLRGPRRREIGHGALVERAFYPVIPNETEFPYTIRLVSEVLESNGSTSMASCCASSLALMDAGVPIKTPVAGIAMGLVKEEDKEVILTDILGEEDFLGDMDFKIAGTTQGITALQMDIKMKEGIGKELLKKVLYEAKGARQFVLDKMSEVISKPRQKIAEFAPRVISLKIDPSKIREVIGPKGKTIHSIIEETGATIDIENDGTVYIASKDEESGEKARQIVEIITKEIKVGEKYLGTVTRTVPFGAFVEIVPGREGLVHISRLSRGRVGRVEDVVKVGDKILVEVVEIDKLNRINLAAAQL